MASAGFAYRNDDLCCEQVRVADLAQRFGTPLYVYSRAAIVERFTQVREVFGADAHVCFAVKSNGNLSLLRLFHELGAGFDLVSGGELRRLRAAGVPASGAVFAGVGKEEWEIAEALAAGILFFNLEAPHEVELFERVAAERGARVPVALRLNPDVDVGSHAFLRTATLGSKFGLDLETAAAVVRRVAASERLTLVGYHVHLGSQIRDVAPYLAAFDKVARFLDADAERSRGVRWYDLGGGFGIADGAQRNALDVRALCQELLPRVRARGLLPVLEPGRFLIADAGILVTRVLGTKRRFVLVDAAMNDLLRPALYQAVHAIAPVRAGRADAGTFDVVGPVCESGDFLGLERALPALERGELLAVFAAGAYGSAMASNYNTRRRPAEVLVDGSDARLIRRRETFDELWATEIDP